LQADIPVPFLSKITAVAIIMALYDTEEMLQLCDIAVNGAWKSLGWRLSSEAAGYRMERGEIQYRPQNELGYYCLDSG
jgi:hypothetical protein